MFAQTQTHLTCSNKEMSAPELAKGFISSVVCCYWIVGWVWLASKSRERMINSDINLQKRKSENIRPNFEEKEKSFETVGSKGCGNICRLLARIEIWERVEHQLHIILKLQRMIMWDVMCRPTGRQLDLLLFDHLRSCVTLCRSSDIRREDYCAWIVGSDVILLGIQQKSQIFSISLSR